MTDSAALVVEIHVPLTPDPAAAASGEEQFPWIDDIVDYLAEVEDTGDIMVVDEGEQSDDHYVFFVAGADEGSLLNVAARVASRPGVPTGVFAMVTDDDAEEVGLGRRVELS